MSKVKMTNGEHTINVDDSNVDAFKTVGYNLVESGKVVMKPVKKVVIEDNDEEETLKEDE